MEEEEEEENLGGRKGHRMKKEERQGGLRLHGGGHVWGRRSDCHEATDLVVAISSPPQAKGCQREGQQGKQRGSN